MTVLRNSEYFARHVVSRMAELGLTQVAVHERGGPSDTTLRKIIEGAPVGMTVATLLKLDQALDWARGSAARTLAGGDPVKTENPTESPIDRQRFMEYARNVLDVPSSRYDDHFDRADRMLTHARDSVRRSDFQIALYGLEGVQSTVELLINRISLLEGASNAQPAPSTPPSSSSQSGTPSEANEDQATAADNAQGLIDNNQAVDVVGDTQTDYDLAGWDSRIEPTGTVEQERRKHEIEPEDVSQDPGSDEPA